MGGKADRPSKHGVDVQEKKHVERVCACGVTDAFNALHESE